MILYHGTDSQSAENIINSGFNLNECSDYGTAAYFSHDVEVARNYGNHILKVEFTGKILDMQFTPHFEIFRNNPNERIKNIGFDGLKDNYITAVYNTKKLKIIDSFNS